MWNVLYGIGELSFIASQRPRNASLDSNDQIWWVGIIYYIYREYYWYQNALLSPLYVFITAEW